MEENTQINEEILIESKTGFVKNIDEQVINETPSSKVLNSFIQSLIDKKVDEYSKILSNSYEKLTKFQQELNKIKPKSNTIDENGKPGPVFYSIDEWKLKTKLHEKINNLEKLISSVLSDNATSKEWFKLNETLQKIN